MPKRPRRERPLRVGLLAGVAVSLLLSGCGTGSAPSPPTGVDELVVPTPSPAAADFGARVDHPLLAATPGTRWTYDDGSTLLAESGPRHRGIATTTLRSTTPDGAGSALHLAQDDAGNVWLLGRTFPGAGAPTWFDTPGLYLPAAPRRGDGYLRAPATDASASSLVEVLTTDGDEVVPAGEYDPVVLLQERGTLRVEAYARGVGPVVLGTAGLSARVSPAD